MKYSKNINFIIILAYTYLSVLKTEDRELCPNAEKKQELIVRGIPNSIPHKRL